LAAQAVAANPEKSNRAITDQIGVSLVTVNKVRNTSGERRCSPEKRAGRDDKSCPSSRAGANPNVKVEPRSVDLSQAA
jgi:hypothetical protein